MTREKGGGDRDKSIATNRKALFNYEIFDRASGRQVLELLRSAATDHGQTIVMVTHDPLAASYARTVLFLADGLVVGRLHDADAAAIAAAMNELER